MLQDITGIFLIPGNGGRDCPGNGTVRGVECACEECDYFLCCEENSMQMCEECGEMACPRKNGSQ